MWGAFGLLVCGLLAWRAPDIVTAARINGVGLRTAALCTQDAATRPTAPGVGGADLGGQAAWLRAVAAQCRGDAAGVQAGFRAALDQAPDRLPLAALAAPDNLALAEYAVAHYPTSAAAYFWLAGGLADHGDKSGAVQAYTQGLALNPANGDVWMALGDLYTAQGDKPHAAPAYAQACVYGDHGKNGCMRAGAVYMQITQYSQAVVAYSRAIVQFGGFYQPAEEGLAAALLAAGRTQEAIPHLQLLARNGSAAAQRTLDQLERQH